MGYSKNPAYSKNKCCTISEKSSSNSWKSFNHNDASKFVDFKHMDKEHKFGTLNNWCHLKPCLLSSHAWPHFFPGPQYLFSLCTFFQYHQEQRIWKISRTWRDKQILFKNDCEHWELRWCLEDSLQNKVVTRTPGASCGCHESSSRNTWGTNTRGNTGHVASLNREWLLKHASKIKVTLCTSSMHQNLT